MTGESSLVRLTDSFDLTKQNVDSLISLLKNKLKGRVSAAYIFGSTALNEQKAESDIDLILISATDKPYTQRAIDFLDLFDIYPALDILVYTTAEFERQIAEPEGFWRSVKESLKRIL